MRPFRLDPTTLQRIDDPPENSTYREAALNLIAHQDYGNICLHAMIRIYEDKVEFANPGNAFDRRMQLLVPGVKKTRNPLIANAFRRIGLSEQAGSGVPQAFTNWRKLGYTPPSIEDDKAHRVFRLTFPKQKLIEEEQAAAIEATGVKFDEKQAMVFAYLYRFGEANALDLMALTGLFNSGAIATADSLVRMGLAQRASTGSPKYLLTFNKALIQNTQENFGNDDKFAEYENEISQSQWTILNLAIKPRSISELMEAANFSHRGYFRTSHLNPLIKLNLIGMTDSNSPSSPHQKYVLTGTGSQILKHHLKLKDETQF